MNTALHSRYRGMGDACGSGASLAHAAVGTGMTTAASILLMAPDPTGITKIAAGVLAVGSIIQNYFFHPDCSKIATTQIVQAAEGMLQQNLAAWRAIPAAQRTVTVQQAALANFDQVWAHVIAACQTGQYGTAGQACVADRQQGACHYQNNGACWNWFVGYRDPIANDPNVVQDTSLSSSTASSAGSVLGMDPNMLLLIGGVAAAGFLLMEFA